MTIAIKTWRITPDEPDEPRTPEKLLEVLTQYFEAPHTKLDVCKGQDGTPLVEIDAVYPLLTLSDSPSLREKLAKLGYSSVLFVGLVDCIADWMGAPTIIDTKTTTSLYTPKAEPSYIRPDYWNQYNLSMQMKGYLWVVSHYLKETLSQVVIDGVGVSKNNERHCFERRDKTYTPSQLAEWRIDTVYLIEQWADCKLAGYFPTNGAPYYCYAYNKPCMYKQLCERPPENREELRELFIQDKWNPLEARKKEEAGIQ